MPRLAGSCPILRSSQMELTVLQTRSMRWASRLASTAVCVLHLPRRVLLPDAFSALGAGETTCAGYPASLGNELVDAQTFADWGIDCTPLREVRHDWGIQTLTVTSDCQISSTITAEYRAAGRISTTHAYQTPMEARTSPTERARTCQTPLRQGTTGARPTQRSGIAGCAMLWRASTVPFSSPCVTGA